MMKKTILAAMFVAAASTFAFAEMATKKAAPSGPAPMVRPDNMPAVASDTTKKGKKAKKAKKAKKHKAKKAKKAKKK